MNKSFISKIIEPNCYMPTSSLNIYIITYYINPFYQVLWKGDWGDKQKTWEPYRHLDYCAAVDEYWADSSRGIAEKAPELPGEHRCQWCCKFYKSHQDLKAHHTRGCDCKPRSKVGGRA